MRVRRFGQCVLLWCLAMASAACAEEIYEGYHSAVSPAGGNYQGGAVFRISGQEEFSRPGARFQNNSFTINYRLGNSAIAYVGGGAVFLRNTEKIVLGRSSFLANSVSITSGDWYEQAGGGAVFVMGDSDRGLTAGNFSDSVFQGNSFQYETVATNDPYSRMLQFSGGGAVALAHTKNYAYYDYNFDSSVFSQNTASVIHNKKASEMHGLVYFGGGAVFAYMTTIVGTTNISFDGARFIGNEVSAQYIYAGSENDSQLYSAQCVGGGGLFLRSVTQLELGSLYFGGNNVSITGALEAKVSPNQAGGGAFFNLAFRSWLRGSIFENNSVTFSGLEGGGRLGGGALYQASGNAYAEDSRFTGNTVSISGQHIIYAGGGAVYSPANSLYFSGSVFTNNTASVTSAHFGTSHAASGGGAVFLEAGGMNLDSTIFTSNRANVSVGTGNEYSVMGGGAILTRGAVSLIGANLIGNSTNGLGGAVLTNGSNAKVTIGALAGETSLWMGNTDSRGANSIHFSSGNLLAVTGGGTIDMRDPISSAGTYLTINQSTKGGSWMLGGHSVLNSDSVTFTVMNGIFHLNPNSSVWMDPEKNTTFKINPSGEYSQGWNSRITAKKITVAENASLHVNGVSGLAIGSHRIDNAFSFADQTSYVPGMGSNFSISNDLMQGWYERTENGYDFVLNVLSSLSDFDDTAKALDILAADPYLSEAQRYLLDSIYARGGITGGAAAVLDTLNSGHNQAAASMLRGNLSNLNLAARTHLAQYSFGALSHDSLQAVRSGAALASPDFAFGNTGAVFRNFIWASAGKRFSRQRNTNKAAGYNYNPYDLVLGYDRVCGPWVFGIAGQYSHGNAKSKDENRSVNKVETGLASVYASYHADRWYGTVGGQLGRGWNKSTTSFGIAGATRGSYHSGAAGANAEFGYLLTAGDREMPLQIIPHAGLEYAHLWTNRFDETGTGPARRFGKTNWDVVEIPVGVKLAKSFCAGGSLITPSVDVSYARNVGKAGAQQTASFVSIPGQSWRIDTVNAERDAYRMQAEIKANLNSRLELNLNYDVELRKKYTDQRIGMSVRVGF